MTDSAMTDSLPPTDPSHVPMQPPHDDARESNGDSRPASAAATDENPAADAARNVNGCTEHVDGEDSVADNCNATNIDVSCASASGPGTVADHAKLPPSSDLRTNGCGGRNLGNSSSAAAILLTNGHIDM